MRIWPTGRVTRAADAGKKKGHVWALCFLGGHARSPSGAACSTGTAQHGTACPSDEPQLQQHTFQSAGVLVPDGCRTNIQTGQRKAGAGGARGAPSRPRPPPAAQSWPARSTPTAGTASRGACCTSGPRPPPRARTVHLAHTAGVSGWARWGAPELRRAAGQAGRDTANN
jgi:hypothetical protein